MSAEKLEATDGLIAIGLGFLVMCAVAVGFLLFKDHRVVRYYVGVGNGHSTRGFCVMSDIPWDQDDEVYCTDNIVNATGIMNDLNQKLAAAPK